MRKSDPGPWRSFIEGRDHTSGSDFIQTAGNDIELPGATRDDQEFIAHARQDIPALPDEIAELNRLLGAQENARPGEITSNSASCSQ